MGVNVEFFNFRKLPTNNPLCFLSFFSLFCSLCPTRIHTCFPLPRPPPFSTYIVVSTGFTICASHLISTVSNLAVLFVCIHQMLFVMGIFPTAPHLIGFDHYIGLSKSKGSQRRMKNPQLNQQVTILSPFLSFCS